MAGPDDGPPAAHTLFPTVIGRCGLVWRGETVLCVRLPQTDEVAMQRFFRERYDANELAHPSTAIAEVIAAIQQTLSDGRGDLSFISRGYGSADDATRRTYDLVRQIPAGSMRTYGDIAIELGDASLARLVGRAMGRNPLPLIVPCHRVVGADGRLIGFTAEGGIELKRRLLIREGAIEPELDL